MKVRMLITQESPKYGTLIEGKVYDLDPEDERKFIERGIAENVSAPDYKSKSMPKKKGQEVTKK